jgi:hypothetical protein
MPKKRCLALRMTTSSLSANSKLWKSGRCGAVIAGERSASVFCEIDNYGAGTNALVDAPRMSASPPIASAQSPSRSGAGGPIGSECRVASTRVSPRWVTAGRTLERRHCLPGLHQHRVEVTATSALPSDLHRQLNDRGGDLRQCPNALCPEFRFGHGGLSRFAFERCHGSSGAADSMCAPRSSPCTVLCVPKI